MNGTPGTPELTLIVIAKRPVAGRVKTRLVPPLTHRQAAGVAAAALGDTLRTVDAAPASRRVLAFDGPADGWLLPSWELARQPAGGLDARLAAAFAAAASIDATGRPTLLVGMDTPQLTAAHLAAFDANRFDACLGLAADGGYWAIGLRDARAAAAAIEGIQMSTEHTGARQLQRLRALGMRVQLLETLTDVDTVDTALEVAALVSGSSFASAVTSATGALTSAAG